MLPPGQIETKRFPVVGERKPSTDIEDWRLLVDGLVPNSYELDLAEFLDLHHRRLTFDIHCVTGWTRFATTFTGVPLSDLIEPLPEARFVSFSAYSTRGHATSLPIDYAMENSWLVHECEGEPLSSEHGGPVRVVTPGKYFYKSVKWLKSIEALAEDRLGWWETESSYHNNANPFAGDERFTSGSLRPQQVERFVHAENFDKYRGKTMIGLDLTGWSPRSDDLRRIYLKNCDLRGARLSGRDLRDSNLSLSDLSGADLRSANLAGSDLEGADLTDADLTDADLSGTALSATRFDGAVVDGLDVEGAWGLLESQASYLRGRGVSLT